MPIPPEHKTNVTVNRRTIDKQDLISVNLSPVRTGPTGDVYFSVEMWLTPGEARRLRDDLTEMLAGPAETKRMEGSR